MARILVTGSNGFLGKHTYNDFKRQGHDVYGIDVIPGITVDNVGDIRQWIGDHSEKFDAIYHFAAFIKGRDSIETQFMAQMDNIAIDTAVINYATVNSKLLVFISSSAVYPLAHQQISHSVLRESMIDFHTQTIGVPDHIYGWTKLTAERLLHEVSTTTDLPIIVFRPFSGYGPEQTCDYPFPNLLRMVMETPDDLKVWGTGEQTRDFVYIDDILRCFTWALDHSCKFDVINIGRGESVSFNELIAIMYQQLYGTSPSTIQQMISRPVGAMYRVADISKLRHYGLIPTTNINEGIVKICHWKN